MDGLKFNLDGLALQGDGSFCLTPEAVLLSNKKNRPRCLITDGELYHCADSVLQGILVNVEFCGVVTCRRAKFRILYAYQSEEGWRQLII